MNNIVKQLNVMTIDELISITDKIEEIIEEKRNGKEITLICVCNSSNNLKYFLESDYDKAVIFANETINKKIESKRMFNIEIYKRDVFESDVEEFLSHG